MFKLKVISEWTYRCNRYKAENCREKAMTGETQTMNFVRHFIQYCLLNQSDLALGE